MTHKIAILGDYNAGSHPHRALSESVFQAAEYLQTSIIGDWIDTDRFDSEAVFNNGYSGLWVAPGSPYKDMENVVRAIQFARENNIPTFGNCGGFQHMLIEIARHVCGISEAGHEETHPGGKDLVITELACSLVRQEEELTITDESSQLFQIIGQAHFRGSYFCRYGINERYKGLLEAGGCLFTAYSGDGQVRAFELKGHPFFLGTLFQPALLSTRESPNPIILSFLRQCIRN
jgi:CTP synthase (UTP-ammonia lyase)